MGLFGVSSRLWYYRIMKEVICTICASIGTAFIYLIGGFDVAIQCLLIAIVLDYISGITKAFIQKNLSSEIGFKGIIKKVAVLLIVMLGVLIDRVTGESGAIRTLVIYYFVANEGLSILENLGECGVPIPKKLKEALKALKKEGSKKNAKTLHD